MISQVFHRLSVHHNDFFPKEKIVHCFRENKNVNFIFQGEGICLQIE